MDGDVLYHLRQIHWGALRFPFLPIHDPFLFFPEGGISPWPGGFDLLLAAVLKAAGFFGFRGTVHEEFLAGSVVSLMGLTGIVLSVTWARALWGAAAGWIAGWLAALIPATVDVSRFGRIDHHVFEPLVLLVGLHPLIDPVLRGVLMGLSLGISQSTLLPLCIVAIASTLSSFLDGPSHNETMAKAALLTAAPVVLATSWAHGVWFDYRQVSLFHLGVVALWFYVSRTVDAKTTRSRVLNGSLAFLLLGAIGLPLLESAQFLETNSVLNLVAESRSGFDFDVIRTNYLSDNLVLWPLALGFLALAVIRKKGVVTAQFELFVAGLIVTVAALLQVRFFPLIAAALAVGVGGFLATVRAHAARTLQRGLEKSEREASVLSFILLSLWLAFSVLRMNVVNLVLPEPAWKELTQATNEVLDWTRLHTPDPGKSGDPRVRPSYGMLAPWYLGHHVICAAQRPAVATPFVFDPSTPGLLDSIQFYFLDSPEAAIGRVRRLKVRYVLVPLLAGEAYVELPLLNPDLALSHRIEFDQGQSLLPDSLFRRTMAGKLYFEDQVTSPSGDSLRVVHEVLVGGSREIKIRLFELIPRGDTPW